MRMTRRRFVECALGGAAAATLPLDFVRPAARARSGCVLLDLGSSCGIRESLAGYESALPALGTSWVHGERMVPDVPELIVVPAAAAMSREAAVLLATHAEAGATVVVELATAFADRSIFDGDREVLRAIMQVQVEPPRNLWPRLSAGIPYVDYHWPSAASVRDFSRVLPMTARDGETIARVDGVSVAVRRRIGSGTLIVLGSPLGPTLLAGDAEARRWLGELVSATSRRAASPSRG